MLKTALKKIIHTDTVTLLEELNQKLLQVRASKDSARILLGEAVEADSADAMAEFERWSKEELKLTARIDGLHRREAELQSKKKSEAKRKVDEASDAAIANLRTYAAEGVEPMVTQVETVIAAFLDRRNQVLATAAAAGNTEALRRAQDSTNVLNFYMQRTLHRLTGIRSTDDPTHGRPFSSYMPELKGK